TKSQIVDHLTQKIGATKKGSCPMLDELAEFSKTMQSAFIALKKNPAMVKKDRLVSCGSHSFIINKFPTHGGHISSFNFIDNFGIKYFLLHLKSL
ncbi:MAG: hypothetical protein ACRENW_04610, partial [Thermodesulfobacteriota bacterium]